MSASFYAAGPNIRDDEVIKRMRNIDVAPTIMRILGVKPDETVDGKALKDILKVAGESFRRSAARYKTKRGPDGHASRPKPYRSGMDEADQRA